MAEAAANKTGEDDTLLDMTAEIVAAYISKNPVATGQLPEIISSVYGSFRALDGDGSGGPLKPAVSIKKSVMPDYLICLEDGKKLMMLKRHLRTNYNLTPDAYRKKWGLPPDYPMVAPNYAQLRSAFAKKIGLGRGAGRSAGRRVAKAK